MPPSGWENVRSTLQASPPVSTGYQRPRELVRIERPQVVQALADADQLDRQPELVRDRDRDAALGRAVELRQRDPAHLDGLAEQARLLQAVLAGRCVDDGDRKSTRLNTSHSYI